MTNSSKLEHLFFLAFVLVPVQCKPSGCLFNNQLIIGLDKIFDRHISARDSLTPLENQLRIHIIRVFIYLLVISYVLDFVFRFRFVRFLELLDHCLSIENQRVFHPILLHEDSYEDNESTHGRKKR